jgi:hypothetical protein
MKYRPWKPSLDTLDAWRSWLRAVAPLAAAAVLLWLVV